MNKIRSSKYLPCCSANSGFTLVELLVAITISAIVFSGVGVILAGTYKVQRVQEGLQEVQEHGRLALEMISRDVRGAGFVGCSEGGISFTNHLNTPVNIPAPIKGYEHTTTGADREWYPSDVTDPPIPATSPDYDQQSDSFVVSFAVASGIEVAALTGTENSTTLTDVATLDVGDLLYLSNCKGSDLFQITGKDPDNNRVTHGLDDSLDPGNATDILGNIYQPGDDVHRFAMARYYVKNDASGVPTLFRSTSNNDADGVALIPWVENMQLLYGEHTAGTSAADTYVQADDVTNWNNVRSVRIALLIRSGQEFGQDSDRAIDTTTPWEVLDYDHPNDNARVRRRVYSTTIEIRNGY